MNRGATGHVHEYAIQWHWLPELPGLSDADRIARYREILDPGVTLGWTPTEESLARAHLCYEHDRACEVGGVAGWIVRIEVETRRD